MQLEGNLCSAGQPGPNRNASYVRLLARMSQAACASMSSQAKGRVELPAQSANNASSREPMALRLRTTTSHMTKQMLGNQRHAVHHSGVV